MPKHGPFIRQYNLKGVQSLYFGINSGQRSSGHTRLRSVPYPHKTQSRNLGMLGSFPLNKKVYFQSENTVKFQQFFRRLCSKTLEQHFSTTGTSPVSGTKKVTSGTEKVPAGSKHLMILNFKFHD